MTPLDRPLAIAAIWLDTALACLDHADRLIALSQDVRRRHYLKLRDEVADVIRMRQASATMRATIRGERLDWPGMDFRFKAWMWMTREQA